MADMIKTNKQTKSLKRILNQLRTCPNWIQCKNNFLPRDLHTCNSLNFMYLTWRKLFSFSGPLEVYFSCFPVLNLWHSMTAFSYPTCLPKETTCCYSIPEKFWFLTWKWIRQWVWLQLKEQVCLSYR